MSYETTLIDERLEKRCLDLVFNCAPKLMRMICQEDESGPAEKLPRRKLTGADVRQIVWLRKQHTSLHDISAAVGRSPSVVWRTLKAHGAL